MPLTLYKNDSYIISFLFHFAQMNMTRNLARGMAGILSTNDREDEDYDVVCRATEALALAFSPWKENQEDGTVNMSNPNIDEKFVESMNELVVEPLRNGDLNGTEAKALLQTMCQQQAKLKNSELYMQVFVENGESSNGSDGTSGSSGGGGGGSSDGNGKSGNQEGTTVSDRVATTSFSPLPRRSTSRREAGANSNAKVLDALSKLHEKLDRIQEPNGTKKGRGVKEREGNGPCSVGDDGCLIC